jgi:hypothetical protein
MPMNTPGLHQDARKLLLHIYYHYGTDVFKTSNLPEQMRKHNIMRLSVRGYIVRLGGVRSGEYRVTKEGVVYMNRFVSSTEMEQYAAV